jgi:hypothetical protein
LLVFAAVISAATVARADILISIDKATHAAHDCLGGLGWALWRRARVEVVEVEALSALHLSEINVDSALLDNLLDCACEIGVAQILHSGGRSL